MSWQEANEAITVSCLFRGKAVLSADESKLDFETFRDALADAGEESGVAYSAVCPDGDKEESASCDLNYYDVDNVRVNVYWTGKRKVAGEKGDWIGEATYFASPKNSEQPFFGFYEGDDNLIAKVGYELDIKGLWLFNRTKTTGEHNVLTIEFYASNVDDEHCLNLRGFAFDKEKGDHKIVVSIFYNGGAPA